MCHRPVEFHQVINKHACNKHVLLLAAYLMRMIDRITNNIRLGLSGRWRYNFHTKYILHKINLWHWET